MIGCSGESAYGESRRILARWAATALGVATSLIGASCIMSSSPPSPRNSGCQSTNSDTSPYTIAPGSAVSVGKVTLALRSAREAAGQAAWEQAVDRAWPAARSFRRSGDRAGELAALTLLGQSYHALGHYSEACTCLHAALTLANQVHDTAGGITVRQDLGAVLTAERQFDDARPTLDEALNMAAQSGNARAEAGILNNLGNLYSDQMGFEKSREAPSASSAAAMEADERKLESSALADYARSAELSAQVRDSRLRATALSNAAVSALRAGLTAEAAHLNADASEAVKLVPDSRNQRFLLITIGRNDQQLSAEGQEDNDLLRQRAEQSYLHAIESAKRANDLLAESYSQGYLGNLYEQEDQRDQALSRTRRAVLAAQAAGSPDSLYRWEWQTGRLLLKAPADHPRAIDAYQRAVSALQSIHSDIALGYGNGNTAKSFRDDVGPVYFGLADLLLERAAHGDQSDQQRQQDRLRAQETIEMLRSGELEDYLQDVCTSQIQRKPIGNIGKQTAVIYIVPLKDRTELLLKFSARNPGTDHDAGEEPLRQVTVPLPAEQLAKVANRFRDELQDRGVYDFADDGKKLYDWLITPLEPLLRQHDVRTLVFVPDGALRQVPMGALWDGEQYLIQKYAVAVTPGLELMEPRSLPRKNVRILLCGLSTSRRGHPALPRVASEVSDIESVFPHAQPLVNANFIVNRAQTELQQNPYSIVHIASHGEFCGNVRKTFLVAWDEDLTLDTLEEMITPAQYQGRPVELLCLSACRTASGDDLAALGLAGVAVKAGARSAVASLWYADDNASAALISEFYRQLINNPDITKAQALQRAQVMLITDKRYTDFQHPICWAPFLVIGNWL